MRSTNHMTWTRLLILWLPLDLLLNKSASLLRRVQLYPRGAPCVAQEASNTPCGVTVVDQTSNLPYQLPATSRSFSYQNPLIPQSQTWSSSSQHSDFLDISHLHLSSPYYVANTSTSIQPPTRYYSPNDNLSIHEYISNEPLSLTNDYGYEENFESLNRFQQNSNPCRPSSSCDSQNSPDGYQPNFDFLDSLISEAKNEVSSENVVQEESQVIPEFPAAPVPLTLSTENPVTVKGADGKEYRVILKPVSEESEENEIPEILPQSTPEVKKTIKKKYKQKRAPSIALCTLNKKEIAERKKEQNRMAAQKYRQRQKETKDEYEEERIYLKKRNAKLRLEADRIENEITRLRTFIFDKT